MVPPPMKDAYVVPNKYPPQGRFEMNRPAGTDLAVQSAMGNSPFPTSITTNFDGLSNLDNEAVIGGRVAPPDPDMDVSDQYIVQMVNLALAVYDKSGNLLFGPVENNAVFAGFGGDCEVDNTGDVIVLYDEDADRWLVSHMSFGGAVPGAECVAVSQTGDPTGAWYRYQFDISTTANNDYPKLGIGDDAYYSSYNMFGGGFLGAIAAAFERDAMIAGDPDAQLILFGPDSGTFSLMPFDIDGGFPTADVPGYFTEIIQDAIRVYEMEVDWDTPGNSTFSQIATLNTSPFDSDLCPAFREACIPQPNGQDLEAISDRIMQRLQFREFANHYSMVFNHTVDADGSGTAGVRWYELRDENKDGTWTLYQEGTYAPADGLSRWMGSIAMDANGNMALGYTASSSEEAPSIRYTGRTAGDPLGQMTFPEEVIASGISQNGTARWGDYSAMVTDATTFWFTHEYGGITGTFNWATKVAQIAFDPDDTTPPDAIADLSASAPSGSVPQGTNVELTWTAPADDAGDNGSGSVTGYDIRVSTTAPITNDAEFEAATPIGSPPPSAPGTSETFLATGLDFDTQFWFAIRASDDNGNTALSNSPDFTTGPAPNVEIDPTSLSATLEPNQTTDLNLNIANTGPAGSQLEFSFPGFAAMSLLETPGIQKNENRSDFPNLDLGKDDVDPREGSEIILGAGGPDNFGYSWIDSNEPGGPTFDWVDISGSGTPLGLGDDDGATVSLPFDFEFYGQIKSDIGISSNGYLTFGTDDSDLSNDAIPDPNDPNDIIALYWDDLDPGNASVGEIYYQDMGDGRFIVQYEGVPHFPDGNLEQSTFQAILYDSGVIKLQYLSMTDDASDTNSHTIGIENSDASDGLQVAFNTDYVEDNLAIEIAFVPDFIASVDPASGTINGGSDQDVTVTLNSQDIEPGIYEKDLVLETNDPGTTQPTVLIPTTLTVAGGTPDIAADPTSLDFGTALEGETLTASFELQNVGNGNLTVTSITSDTPEFVPTVSGGFDIDFGGQVTIPIEFTPSAVGPFSGSIIVESTDPDEPTFTVPVTGEGVPAPVVGTDPEELFEALEIGQTSTQTLTILNTGGSDLDFNLSFVEANAPDLAPEDVAAPTAVGGTSSDAFSDAGADGGNAAPQPNAPDDYEYILDDGTTENALGLTNGGDIMWINAFNVVEGAGTITSVATTYGSVGGTGQPPAGAPTTVFIYDDPNDDGNPTDAVLLAEVSSSVQDPGTDTFIEEAFPPTPVDGVFFIAVLQRNQAAGTFPAPLDQDNSQAASWVVGNTTPGAFDEENLGANDVAPTLMDDIGFPGNWLLRADGSANFVAYVPASGTVPPGGSIDVDVTFDASGLDVGTYAGNTVVSSNDPVTPDLNVPTTLEVTSAPYPFLLDPDAIEVTIDVNEDEDEVETRQVTITNDTDEEQSFEVSVQGAEGAAPVLTPHFADDEARLAYERMQQAAAEGIYPQGDAETSMGAAPMLIDTPFNGMLAPVGVTGYSSSVFGTLSGQFVSLDLGVPGTLTTFGASPTAFAGDFLLGDEESFLIVNNSDGQLYEVDATTGTPTAIGPVSLNGSQSMTELATDPTNGTLYGMGTDCTNSTLYVVDPSDASTTAIGTTSGVCLINAAVDADGNMYALDIISDQLYSVDKFSGAATAIGPIGFNANFAQGMDYDPVTATMYLFAYNNATGGELRTADLATGATTLIGPFQGNDELGYAAIPSQGFLFLDTDLVAGTLAPGGSVTIDVNISSEGLIAGTYEGEVVVTAEVPGNPEESVPVTLNVIADPVAEVAPASIDFPDTFVNDTSSDQVTLLNTGREDLEVSSVAIDNAAFTIEDAMNVTTPFTIEPGDARTFTVTFAPTDVQSYSGTLTFETNAPTDGTQTVALSGEGIPAPELALDPESFDLQMYVGQTYERTLTVGNPGGNPLEYSLEAQFVSFDGGNVAEVRPTLLQEDFEEGVGILPDGWTRETLGVGWQIGDDLGSSFWSIPANTIYAASNDDAPGPANDGSEDYLITPPLDFSGFTTVEVAFDSYFTGSFSQLAFVEVSLDGGNTWEVVDSPPEQFSWTRVTVDLSDYAGEPNVLVGFHADDDGFWASGWAVDDVEVYVPATYLTVDPTEGTVPAGDSEDLTLSFDATGLAPGTYETELLISSNDPVADQPTIVPITLDVVSEVTMFLDEQNIEELTDETPESDDEIHPTSVFNLPVAVTSLQDLEVQSYEFDLSFDNSLVNVTEVIATGTLSEGLNIATNIDNASGTVSVAVADEGGAGPILLGPSYIEEENGEPMLILQFEALEQGHGTVAMDFDSALLNEGAPPVTTIGANIDIVPLYGDANLNLMVNAFDASVVLEHVVGLRSFTPAASTQANVTSGDITAFDASKILEFSAGAIDCFPAEPGCGDNVASKAGYRTIPSADLLWGEAESGKQEGLTHVPLKAEMVQGEITSVYLEVPFDESQATLQGVASSMPEGWTLVHNLSDGQLQIAMAGTGPLQGGELATLALQWKTPEAQMSLDGLARFNEENPDVIKGMNVGVIPESFTLKGNYPNPFNPSTTIRFNLPEQAEVSLEVIDMLGRRVMTVPAQSMQAGANRELSVNASSLASGAYIYRVIAKMADETQLLTGRMTLVK